MTAPAPRGRAPWRLLLGLPLVLVVLSTPWWGPRALAQLAYFRVRRVEVVGARYVPPGDILRRLAVDTTASVWHAPRPLEARVAAHPAVAAARVRRRLPGTLVVEVEERVPVALVPGATGFAVYDAGGAKLPIDPARVAVDAPVLARRDTAVLRLLGELRAGAPALFARVSEIRRQARGELWLRVASIPVRATDDLTVARLQELDPVAQDLARRRLRPAELDLRYRDQVIARLP